MPANVFISYAHVDNTPITSEDRGWVNDFVELLGSYLARKSGRRDEVRIWHDPVLRGNGVFDEVIREAIDTCTVFVGILSPGYIHRDSYCLKEVEFFGNGRSPLVVNNQCRAFAVLIDEIPPDRWPAPFRGTSGYKFTQRDPSTQTTRLLRRPSATDREQGYWTMMEKICSDVWHTLELIAKTSVPGPEILSRVARSGPSVYLAEVTDDFLDYREKLEKELVQKGVLVEPGADSALPQDPQLLSDAIRQRAITARLSVHLLGKTAGRPIRGLDRTLSHLQCEITVTETKLRPFPIIWIPPETDPSSITNEPYKLFIERLLGSNREGIAAEVLRCDLEDLKDEIMSRLSAGLAEIKVASRNAPEPNVYITHRARTTSELDALQAYFLARKCAVSVLDHSSAPDEVQRRHRRWLRICDGLLILFDRATRSWAEDTALEAREFARGKRRPRKLAVAELPPKGDGLFGVRASSMLFLTYDAEGELRGADEFIRALMEDANA